MKIKFLAALLIFGIQQNIAQNIFVPKLTGNNAASLTDVVYVGKKDSVLVSKYNGQINLVLNNKKNVKEIANLKDEVYALAYHPKSKEIIASTLGNGVFVIDFPSGKIKQKLPVKDSWTNTLRFSSDFKYLIGQNQNKQTILWEVGKNYKKVELDSKFPSGTTIDIKDNTATVFGIKKMVKWDINTNLETESREVEVSFFSDIDKQNNIASIYLNEFIIYDYNKKKSTFKLRHPDYKYTNGGTGKKEEFTDEISLGISSVKFCKDFILSSGADNSFRIWNKNTGKLLKTFWEHKRTVNKIVCSEDQSQVVTIDLGGGIYFRDVNSF
ncbi:hypothetical protein NAT51_16305 [Flavobacterium amniphilum]|uniref:WD40 repeat domain-containing protein n=1 Tax=Flavobacterium amniphilum TaxID=1834035 RepID=UPI00202A4D67|nr:hypothetical protein [Flavobacterium amniphilum]MCL9807099.1 hypothetical protein [Flavobacterium amniphilum]